MVGVPTAQWLVLASSSVGTKVCLRFTKWFWVGKHVNIIMKPTNSPTLGQPNPRKISFKVTFGPFFAQKIFFRGLGLFFHRKKTTRHPNQPNYQQTPYWVVRHLMQWLMLGGSPADTMVGQKMLLIPLRGPALNTYPGSGREYCTRLIIHVWAQTFIIFPARVIGG